MIAQVPQDYAHRWYVQDEIADALAGYLKAHPQAKAPELERAATSAVRDCYRAEFRREAN